MRVSVSVKGMDGLVARLKAREVKGGGRKAAVAVGYGGSEPSSKYALYVHENMNLSHPFHRGHNCGGQAKYLTGALAAAMPHMVQAVRDVLAQGSSPAEAAREAGNVLLVESLPLVPVLTGALKDSAYVRPVKA